MDLIIEITNYSQQITFEEELRRRGFVDDTTSKIRGRFRIGNITTIDVHTGFKNICYPEGYRNAMVYQLDNETTIKILTAPYFIATKFEALKSRGGRDLRGSHDFEDIIHVLEYREDIWSELMETEGELNAYLKKEFKAILDSPDVEEWIDCHVDFTSPPSTYFIIDELRNFVDALFSLRMNLNKPSMWYQNIQLLSQVRKIDQDDCETDADLKPPTNKSLGIQIA